MIIIGTVDRFYMFMNTYRFTVISPINLYGSCAISRLLCFILCFIYLLNCSEISKKNCHAT